MKEEEEEEMVMEELINCSYCFQSYHRTKEIMEEHQKNLPLTYHTMPMCCCGLPLIHSDADGKLCASWRRTTSRSRTRMQAIDREAVHER
jgi:hypothetical protein